MKTTIVGLAGLLAAAGCGGPPQSEVSAALTTAIPKPIASGDYFPTSPHHRAGIIHQWYPVTGFDGPWAEPNGMTDFSGTVAQVFQGGTAIDSTGKSWNIDVDNRVYQGTFIARDGTWSNGTFCEI